MRELIAFVSSDWHVRRRDQVWSRWPQIRGDLSAALAQLERDMTLERPPALLLGGDNFHEPLQHSDGLQRMRAFMDRSREIGVPIHYVQGQHELATPPLLQALHDWPQHAHRRHWRLGGVTFAGLDFSWPHQAQEDFATLGGADVLLTHQLWQRLMGPTLGVVDLRWADKFQLVLSGDYHQARYVCATPTAPEGRQPALLSIGPPCRQAIDEPGPFGFWRLYDNLTVEFSPLPSRRCESLYIQGEADLEEQLPRIAELAEPGDDVLEEIAKPLLVVRYRSDTPRLVARVLRAVDDRAHVFFLPTPAPRSDEPAAPQAPADECRDLAQCVRLIAQQQGVSDEALALALHCVQAAAPAEAARAFWTTLTAPQPAAK